MATELFISTSVHTGSLCSVSCSKKITNLSHTDIKKILKRVSDFPTMIQSSDEGDHRFINDFQCAVIFSNGDYNPQLDGTQKVLVVTTFEKTLYYI